MILTTHLNRLSVAATCHNQLTIKQRQMREKNYCNKKIITYYAEESSIINLCFSVPDVNVRAFSLLAYQMVENVLHMKVSGRQPFKICIDIMAAKIIV